MPTSNQVISRHKTYWKICYELLKSIFIIVKIIRSSSDHSVFSWVNNTYKYLFDVEIYDILIATENIICFERLKQEFDTLFDYTLQEDSKLKLLNINIIQSKSGISIYQTYHIMNNIIQEYWGTKTKEEVKYQHYSLPTDTSFEQTLFVDIPLIVSEMNKIGKKHGGSLNHWVGGLMHITVQTRYDI